MGVEGKGVVFYKAVATLAKSGTSLHIEHKVASRPIPLMNHRIAEFMTFDVGADGIKAVGLFHRE